MSLIQFLNYNAGALTALVTLALLFVTAFLRVDDLPASRRKQGNQAYWFYARGLYPTSVLMKSTRIL